MFPVIVSGSLTLTRLVPRRRSPVPSLFWFIHTFCGCPRRRSPVPSHRFWSGVPPDHQPQPSLEQRRENAPTRPRANNRKVCPFPARPALAHSHTRAKRQGGPPKRGRKRESTDREREGCSFTSLALVSAHAHRGKRVSRERGERESIRDTERLLRQTDRQTDRQAGR